MNYKWLGLGAALVLLLNGCGRDLPAPQEYSGDYSRMAYIETAKPLSYGEWERVLSLPEVTDYDLSLIHISHWRSSQRMRCGILPPRSASAAPKSPRCV